MTHQEQADALEQMLASVGWQLFTAHVGVEWGPKAYAQKLKAAVQHARSVGSDTGKAIEIIDEANDAIAEAMRWPSEEVMKIRRQEQPVAHSPARGGYR